MNTKKIRPFLWFNDKAEEAAKFYVSIFKNSKILNVSPMIVNFELDGQELMALNGGPEFKFTEAISLFVNCKDQNEVDYFWEKLSESGEEGKCGWLKDKYGLSWQIIPETFGKLMSDEDDKKTDRVLKAMFKMNKMDVNALEKAYNDES